MGLDRNCQAAAAVSRCFLHPEQAASYPVQQSLLHAHGEIPANVSVATLSPFLHSHENLLPYRVKIDDGVHGKISQNNMKNKNLGVLQASEMLFIFNFFLFIQKNDF